MTAERWSCKWIEGGIAFSPRAVHLCCVCHHGDKGWPRIADFQGGPVPVDDILRVRREALEKINRREHEDCIGCPLLEPHANDREYLLDCVNICNSTICNLSCRYCYLQSAGKATRWWNDPAVLKAGRKPYDLLPTIESMIGLGQLSPKANIYWASGEPTLLAGFDEMIQLTLDHGTWNFVATNATVLSQAILDGLPYGRVAVDCSVDAGTPETYERMKGRPRFYEVWANLAAYAAAGGVVEAKYVVTKENCSERDARGFIKMAGEAGIRRIICDVDAFDPVLTKPIASAIALIRRLAGDAGMEAVVAGCGVAAFPEKDVEANVLSVKEHRSFLHRLKRFLPDRRSLFTSRFRRKN